MTKKKKLLYNIFLPIITLICLIVIWSIAAISVGSKYVLPTVGETFTALFGVLRNGDFYVAFLLTLLRSFIAFVVSFVLATVLAVLSKKYYVAKKLISPFIAITRTLPTVAVVLLLLFWTTSQVAPVIVTMLVVLPTAFTNIDNALSMIDDNQLEMCKVFNVPYKTILKKVIIPQITPSMLTTAGACFALNLKLMVAAEVLSSTANSIGNMLNFANFNLETAEMLALVVITVVTGIVIEAVFSAVSKKIGRWKNDKA